MSVSKFTINFLRRNSVLSAGASGSNVFCDRGFGSAQPILKKIPEKKPDWNKAVAEAEKIVGYTTSFMSLRWLLSDEVANVAMHMRKLVGSNHPLLKAAKGLVFNGKNNMQAWGLIVLLISKALGYTSSVKASDEDKVAGFLHTQRALAEVTEMIRTSHLIHKGLMNMQNNSTEDISGDMIFGNKIALLSGDYLLSNSCMELANLQNQELVELMSSAVRDLSESEFLGPRDLQNNPLPSPPRSQSSLYRFNFAEDPLDPVKIGDALGNAEAEWTLRNILESGSLLGKSCQGALKLAGHSAKIQKQAYRFGRHLALSWQACLDCQPFSPGATGSFSLVSAPVLYTLQDNHDLYREIEIGSKNVNEVDFERLRQNVLAGPGVQMTKNLQQEHSDIAFEFLEKLPDSEARTALINIMTALI
ncbi:hypothetical protein WA026_003544 [Henosepilachna vigintioctopunctata]|uniref:Decaprenyl-diphosphate synthase subunit 2 n=1 Tax=Henosepilachna vigintioctopunctata TaxID=420089 RepID=A0AAW1TJ71_9CUCU